MIRIRTAIVAATATAGLLLLPACGSSKSPAATGTASAAPSASASAQAGARSGTRLVATKVGKLGTVVTDGAGMTLYRFDNDTNKPPTSNCNGTCAQNWPAVLAGSGEVELSGVDKALVGKITRADGTIQLTLNGWALYRYAKDTKPGDTLGQGVGGTWFAITPEGKKATETAASPTSGNDMYGY